MFFSSMPSHDAKILLFFILTSFVLEEGYRNRVVGKPHKQRETP